MDLIVAGTGHRPNRLGGYGEDIFEALTQLATTYLTKTNPVHVLSGMALGWDQALALAAIRLNLSVTAVIPFQGQDNRWPEDARARYASLVSWCDRVVIVSDVKGDFHVARAMQDRNRWLVDHSTRLVALWDGSWRSGTSNCIRYAMERQRPIDNLWEDWNKTINSKGEV